MSDHSETPKPRDILERLDLLWPGMGEMANDERREAAREIRALRDEARRMYCKEVEHHHETVWNDGERDFKPFPSLDVAISKGWDCFKEDGK